MEREPVRLTGWAAIAASVVLQALVALLSGMEWREVALQVLLTVAPLVGGLELARSKVVSPDTLMRATGHRLTDLDG